MPAELADTQITLKELGAFREVLRQLRALLVALEFIQNSSRTVTEADLHWVAEHILHTKLTKAQVGHDGLSPTCDRSGPAWGWRIAPCMPACQAQGCAVWECSVVVSRAMPHAAAQKMPASAVGQVLAE